MFGKPSISPLVMLKRTKHKLRELRNAVLLTALLFLCGIDIEPLLNWILRG